ncbi:MAG: hypothetical protein NTW04_05275, partial [Elusimicrobia bacterium]|nr:hypothetical protein [Elusimicrobiota bacterium]
QATTEVVLMIPIFMALLFITVKMFGLLLLMQKLEIATTYAAKRWQLESHRNFDFLSYDEGFLLRDITRKVKDIIGYNSEAARSFLNITDVEVDISRLQVWNQVVVRVGTKPIDVPLLCKSPKVCDRYGDACIRGYRFLCEHGAEFEDVKYVINRDRAVKYLLPGIH